MPSKPKLKYGLTDKQINCAEEYINNGFKMNEAIKNIYNPSDAHLSQLKRRLIESSDFIKYLARIIDRRDNMIAVDKLYVVNKLKKISEKGTNMEKLRALELLGKYLQMFTEKQIIESSENNPAAIANQVIKKRLEEEKAKKKAGNCVEFNKEAIND